MIAALALPEIPEGHSFPQEEAHHGQCQFRYQGKVVAGLGRDQVQHLRAGNGPDQDQQGDPGYMQPLTHGVSAERQQHDSPIRSNSWIWFIAALGSGAESGLPGIVALPATRPATRYCLRCLYT